MSGRLLEASAGERAFRRRTAELLVALDHLEVDAVRVVAERTRRLRAELVAALEGASGWTPYWLPRILAEVERALEGWAADAAGAASRSMLPAGALGEDLGAAAAVAAGSPGVHPIVTHDLVSALDVATADLVRGVAEDARRAVAREVRSAALGLQKPTEAIGAVGRIVQGIRQPVRDADGAVVGSRHVGPMARAETIVRTEVNRVFSVASDEAMRTVAGSVSGMRREWVATRDDRTRWAHRAAHGQVVGMDEDFLVGGARLRYPRDPSGPAAQVVNCRCVALPLLPGWDGAPALPEGLPSRHAS